LIRSLANAQGIRLGFETGGVWLADCKLSAPDTGIQERIAGELRAAFGNTSVSAIQVLPLQGRAMDGPVEINGRTVLARFNGVGDGHFTLLRIPLRLGREFTWRDGAHSLPVAVVNEAFSRAYGASLGKTLRAFPDNQAREIVGVVADHVYSNLRETVRPAIYRPLAQVPAAQFSWEIRGPGTASFGVRLAEVLRGAPAGAAMGRVRPLEQLFRDELWQSRVTTGFVAAFAGLALLLAAVGLYGIVAYSVTQRRREMGVRVALGARPAEVAGLFLRRVAVLICAGTVAGNLLAMGAAGLLRSQLYGVGATDPWTIAGADVVLAMVAAAAVVVPTARAVAVDVAEVLRED
jgi:hypothetical protein